MFWRRLETGNHLIRNLHEGKKTVDALLVAVAGSAPVQDTIGEVLLDGVSYISAGAAGLANYVWTE